MTHIIDLVDMEALEAGLREGTFSSKDGFYNEVARQLGSKADQGQVDALRDSLFPEERGILLDLPYRDLSVNFDPELVADKMGKTCSNGIHKFTKPEHLVLRKGRTSCRRCELARGSESKRRARERARAEREKNPKPKPARKRWQPPPRKPKKRKELTVKEVLAIRADYADHGEVWGWTARVAKQYDMSPEAIRAIAKRRTWKDV